MSGVACRIEGFIEKKSRKRAPMARRVGGPIHKLVSPEGVLHLLPDDKRAKEKLDYPDYSLITRILGNRILITSTTLVIES